MFVIVCFHGMSHRRRTPVIVDVVNICRHNSWASSCLVHSSQGIVQAVNTCRAVLVGAIKSI